MEEKQSELGNPCAWACANTLLKCYHDTEWGIPVHDDYKMFEYLLLECFQCGLSWNLMLKKRSIFQKNFSDFDYNKVANYSEKTVERILKTEGMIRSERKIRALIHNARCFLKIREKYGTFCHYLWSFSNGKTLLYKSHELGDFPARNELSDKISYALKGQGFKYIGTITTYALLQSCGIINDHAKTCPCYQRIVENYPTTPMPQEIR